MNIHNRLSFYFGWSILVLCIVLLDLQSVYGQEEVFIESNGVKIFGTLTKPDKPTQTVVLIIAGSGPTDRNGNSGLSYNNYAYKMLADSLANAGIATLRFDKRGIGKSKSAAIQMELLRIEDFAMDVVNWIKYLEPSFERIVVAGHSLGSLIGTLAIQEQPVKGFIALAGVGDTAYNTLKRQLSNQPKMVTDAAIPILELLNQGEKVDSVPFFLMSLFRPSIQDYLLSWMKYNPREEIKKLDIPVLVVQGNTDLQVTVEEARAMSAEVVNGKLVIIDEMNHILKPSSDNLIENYSTYNKPELSLHPALMPPILAFIHSL